MLPFGNERNKSEKLWLRLIEWKEDLSFSAFLLLEKKINVFLPFSFPSRSAKVWASYSLMSIHLELNEEGCKVCEIFSGDASKYGHATCSTITARYERDKIAQ